MFVTMLFKAFKSLLLKTTIDYKKEKGKLTLKKVLLIQIYEVSEHQGSHSAPPDYGLSLGVFPLLDHFLMSEYLAHLDLTHLVEYLLLRFAYLPFVFAL